MSCPLPRLDLPLRVEVAPRLVETPAACFVSLRQQLGALRQQLKRPQVRFADRLFWTWLHRFWGRRREALIFVRLRGAGARAPARRPLQRDRQPHGAVDGAAGGRSLPMGIGATTPASRSRTRSSGDFVRESGAWDGHRGGAHRVSVAVAEPVRRETDRVSYAASASTTSSCWGRSTCGGFSASTSATTTGRERTSRSRRTVRSRGPCSRPGWARSWSVPEVGGLYHRYERRAA